MQVFDSFQLVRFLVAGFFAVASLSSIFPIMAVSAEIYHENGVLMSDILKITTPMTPKNYTAPAMRQPLAAEQFIDIANLSKVIKTNDKTETGKQDVNEFQSKEPLTELSRLLRDPSLGAGALKNLLSNDLLSALAKLSGTNLGKQLSDLVNSVFINSDFLSAEIADQQKFMSIFKGEIFDYMRAILDAAPDSEEVKLAVGNFLKAVVAEKSQGEMLLAVSSNLESLAKEIAPLKELANSLIALSIAFKDPTSASNVPKLRAAMFSVFAEISGSILMDSKVERLMSLTIYNISKYNSSPNLIKNHFEALLTIFSEDSFKETLREVLHSFLNTQQLPDTATKPPFEAILRGDNASDDLLKSELEAFQKALSTGETAAPAASPKNMTPSEELNLASILSKLMTKEDATKLALELVTVPEKGEAAAKADVEKTAAQFASSKATSDKESTAEVAKAKTGEAGITKSALNLVDMLKENLSNPLLRSMTGSDVTNLLRSLLVAPNGSAAMLHFILPAREGPVRSFGELWVDPDPEKGNTTREERNAVHMLLSADIPDIGYFEIELLTKANNLNILLLCPPKYIKEFSSLKNDIAKSASALGFSVRGMNIAGLVRKRSLPEVFPTVYDNKNGLNIKV